MKTLLTLTEKQSQHISEFAKRTGMNATTLQDAAAKLADLPMFLFPSDEAWQEWDEILTSLATDHNITSVD